MFLITGKNEVIIEDLSFTTETDINELISSNIISTLYSYFN